MKNGPANIDTSIAHINKNGKWTSEIGHDTGTAYQISRSFSVI